MTIFRSRPMVWPKHFTPPTNPRLVYRTTTKATK